jgi:hypothetical protein
MPLLTNGNSDLRRDRIWTWTLPAWVVTLPDGGKFNTCPSAGECAPMCYARKGTYRFSNVLNAHMRNLMLILESLPEWERAMSRELDHPKFHDAHVRVHDAGDFFNDQYLEAWLRIITDHPHTVFYCYTKEVGRFRRIVEPRTLPNFRYVYSYGGRQDSAIMDSDRRCDVFPSNESLEDAGFHDQKDSDLLAIYGPTEVGIVINNHPGAVKRMDGQSLRQMQQRRHSRGAVNGDS